MRQERFGTQSRTGTKMLDNIEIRDVRWTTRDDFSLPAWYRLQNWKKGYRNLWIGANDQNQIEEKEFILNDWKSFETAINSICKSRQSRFLLYVPVSAKGKKDALWSEVLEALNETTPLWNSRFEPVPLEKYGEPHLALCLDTKNVDSDVSCTYLVPHWESIGFLELLLFSFEKTFENQIRPNILIVDDGSSAETFKEATRICNEYKVEIRQIQRVDKGKVADVGAVLDFGLNFVQTEFVCMIDADVVIIDSKIDKSFQQILRDKSVISIGLDTNLADDYHSNFLWGKNKISKLPGRQLPGYFSVTNNLFRYMRTLDARAVSQNCGFKRATMDRKSRDQLGRVLRKVARRFLTPGQNALVNDLINRKMLNSRFPIMPPTCDNGVAANAWIDQNMMGAKWNTPITSYGILTKADGIAFQNISELLVHIALSTRALSETRREVDDAGEKFYAAVKNIVERTTSLEERYYTVVKLSMDIRNS